MARTTLKLEAHIQGILSALSSLTFPIGDGERPKKVDNTFEDPPYAMVTLFPGGEFDGPLSDSQADTTLNIHVRGVGKTQREALNVLDLIRALMKKDSVTITGRKIRDIRLEAASGGAERDDDLPTPHYIGYDIYEINTTPS